MSDRNGARRELGWHNLPEGSAERDVIDLQLDKARAHARNVGGSVGKEAWNAAFLRVSSERVGAHGDPSTALQIARNEVQLTKLAERLAGPHEVAEEPGILHGLADARMAIAVLKDEPAFSQQEWREIRAAIAQEEKGMDLLSSEDVTSQIKDRYSRNPEETMRRMMTPMEALSPEAEDFRDALASRFEFSDDPRVQQRLTEYSHLAAQRLDLVGKSATEIEAAAASIAAKQAEIGDYRGAWMNALDKVAGDRVVRQEPQQKSELWNVASELENQAVANKEQGEKTEFLRRSVVNVGEEAIAHDATAKERFVDQQNRTTETDLTVDQIRGAAAFDQRFGSTAIEYLNHPENGHSNRVSTAILLDKASVLADQAENPTSVADADAIMSEMSSLERTLAANANGQAEDVAGVLYGAADDVDPETLRALTQDTAQDVRENLARKAELYAAGVGAAPDSSLGAAVQKFAGDVRSGRDAIDMTQWFEPQPGVSIESNERLAGATHQRVMEGMKPLLQEAQDMGIQVDIGAVKISQKPRIKEDVAVAKQGIGF